MNSLIQNEFPLQEAQRERYELLQALTDADLAYKLPGDNPTFGELCREMGEIEHNYIQSFKTFKYQPTYYNAEPEIATSTARLQAWYRALDEEFERVMQAFSDEDLQGKHIDRGQGFMPTLFVQFEIYREALLMFYAKASVYLKALGKRVNDGWHAGIG